MAAVAGPSRPLAEETALRGDHGCDGLAGACREPPDSLRPYLEGYSRGDPAALRTLLGHDWQAAALGELRRRHERLLGALDEATLKQLACGMLDLGAAAARLAAELEARPDRSAGP